MDSDVQDGVQRLEEYIDRHLKPDLVHNIAERY